MKGAARDFQEPKTNDAESNQFLCPVSSNHTIHPRSLASNKMRSDSQTIWSDMFREMTTFFENLSMIFETLAGSMPVAGNPRFATLGKSIREIVVRRGDEGVPFARPLGRS
jgi:hypothetical protein